MKIKEIKIINQDESTEIADIGADAINVDYNETTVKAELDKLNNNDTLLLNTQNNLQSQISNLASGSPAGVYNTVAALTSADPDHSKIYVVTENGHWYYYNNGWQDGGVYQAMKVSITDPVIEDLENQILNYTNISEKEYINASSTLVQQNLIWGFKIPYNVASLEFIPIFSTNSGTYTATRYRSETSIDTGVEYSLVESKNANIGDGVKFYKLTDKEFITISSSARLYYTTNTTNPEFLGNGLYINNNTVSVLNNIYIGGTYKEVINDFNIDNIELKLYNKVLGGVHATHQVVSITGELSYKASDSNYRTNTYAVNSNTYYWITTKAKGSSMPVVAFFNDDTFISYNTLISTSLIEYNIMIKTPSNCNKMIVNGYYPNNIIVKEHGETLKSSYAGELFETIGDSRTWYDQHVFGTGTTESGTICNGYQYYLRNELGISTFNEGHSGWTTSQLASRITNNSYAFMHTGFNNIILAGGVNDWLHNVEIGTINEIGSTFDNTTVYGALQTIIETLMLNKNIKIFMLTPFTGWSNGDEYSKLYTEARINIAKLYNIPILNLTESSRLNQINKNEYYVDDTATVSYQLHLTNKGYAYIKNQICQFINNN